MTNEQFLDITIERLNHFQSTNHWAGRIPKKYRPDDLEWFISFLKNKCPILNLHPQIHPGVYGNVFIEWTNDEIQSGREFEIDLNLETRIGIWSMWEYNTLNEWTFEINVDDISSWEWIMNYCLNAT